MDGPTQRSFRDEPDGRPSPQFDVERMEGLSAELCRKIWAFCSEGDRLAEVRNFGAAVQLYNRAWRLVPHPKHQWGVSTFILAAIAEACFLGDYLAEARDALRLAMFCPGGAGSPVLHLRLGQVLLDRGEFDQALDELAHAYVGGGEDVFVGEDPRYRSFLDQRMGAL